MVPGKCDWVDGKCYEASCTERILTVIDSAKIEDFKTEYDNGRNEIRNTFRFTSDGLGDGCFTGHLEALMKD